MVCGEWCDRKQNPSNVRKNSQGSDLTTVLFISMMMYEHDDV